MKQLLAGLAALILAATITSQQYQVSVDLLSGIVNIGTGDTVEVTNSTDGDVTVSLSNTDGALILEFIVVANTTERRTISQDVLVKARDLPVDDTKAICCKDCFPGDTLVATPAGLRAIAELKAGQRVFAADGRAATIDAVQKSMASTLVHVALADRSVRASRGHRFLTLRGWQPADRLRPGDRVVTNDGTLPVTSATIVDLPKPVAVYNLVLAAGRFQVSEARIVVDSKRPNDATRPTNASSLMPRTSRQ